MTCPRCRGTVTVPAEPAANVTCPFCQQFLVAVDPRTGATWKAPRPWPGWLTWAIATAAGLLKWAIATAAALLWLVIWLTTLEPNFRYLGNTMVNPAFWGPLAVAIYIAWRRRWLG